MKGRETVPTRLLLTPAEIRLFVTWKSHPFLHDSVSLTKRATQIVGNPFCSPEDDFQPGQKRGVFLPLQAANLS